MTVEQDGLGGAPLPTTPQSTPGKRGLRVAMGSQARLPKVRLTASVMRTCAPSTRGSTPAPSAEQPYEPASDEEQPGGGEQPNAQSATAASDLIAYSSEATLGGTGGDPGEPDGHPCGQGNQADEQEDDTLSAAISTSAVGDLFGGWRDEGQCRDVRRHGEHAERKRRPSLARTTRTLSSPTLRLGDPARSRPETKTRTATLTGPSRERGRASRRGAARSGARSRVRTARWRRRSRTL